MVYPGENKNHLSFGFPLPQKTSENFRKPQLELSLMVGTCLMSPAADDLGDGFSAMSQRCLNHAK
jgi:hypothetical protein